MTTLKFYTDDGLHEWEHLSVFHGNTPVVLMCNTTRLIPFCYSYLTLAETIDDVVVEYLDGSTLTLDSHADFLLTGDGTHNFITYNGEAVLSGGVALDAGLARITIEMSGATVFYSDYFQICALDETCESNSQLVDNNLFSNWTGDDPDDWTVSTEDGANYITDDGGGVAEIITADPGIITISQDILEVGRIYAITVILSGYTSGSLYAGGVANSPTMDSAATFTFYGVATSNIFSLFTNTVGVTSLKITSVTVTMMNRCIIDDYFNLFWSSHCDLPAPANILYQTGFENHLAFDGLPIRPETQLVIEGEVDESLLETVLSIANKKIYQVEFLGGESLFDALSVIRFHEYIYVAWPDQVVARAYNVEFTANWVDDYLCQITLKFNLLTLKKGGCCDNFTLT